MAVDGGGWLGGINQLRSPNCDLRPTGCVVDLLVIHCISLPRGQYLNGDVEALFLNTLDCTRHPSYGELEGLRVSAHFLIDRQGIATQFVSLADRAWHAGVSGFDGRTACNDFSIGVELEGVDDGLFEPEQYETLHRIVAAVRRFSPAITPERIVGHSDIAPGRKADPGPGFDWERARAVWRTQR